ncbi:hypothetical protein BD560DRAFT_392906 [Blakeslea trispora]|nr:hypothetical protein BD560DRAFT_392906 [Blakeslea trispora]
MTFMSSDNSSRKIIELDNNVFPEMKRRSTRKIKKPSSYLVAPDDDFIKRPKKLGRKPLETEKVTPIDPKLKRKAQNRAAQRAFRERKEQFVSELQQQLAELKRAKDKAEQELLRENARLQLENQKLKKENRLLRSTSLDDSILKSSGTPLSIIETHSSPLQRGKDGAWLNDAVLSTASDEILSDFQGTSSVVSTPVMQYSPMIMQSQHNQEESNSLTQSFATLDDEIIHVNEHQGNYPMNQTNTMIDLFGSEMNLFDHSPNMTRLDSYFF